MRSGVPFGAAFGLSPGDEAGIRLSDVERTAFAIVFSEFEGAGRFDFETMSFPRA